MHETLLLATGALAVVTLCLLGLLAHERARSLEERRSWAEERSQLLDRIMAVDYTRFFLPRTSLNTPHVTTEESYNPREDESIAGTVQHIADDN